MKYSASTEDEGMAIIKRMFYLAWKACGGPVGMGVFQDRRLEGREATEEEVWRNVVGAEDYGGCKFSNREDEFYGDYVFGRMMKWGCRLDGTTIDIPERSPYRPDYQGFAHKYPSPLSLLVASLNSLGLEYQGVEEEGAEGSD